MTQANSALLDAVAKAAARAEAAEQRAHAAEASWAVAH
jgi:hypothetical protein